MQWYTARTLKFKAWNKDEKLLMRLNSIDCNRGELFKTNHILLQFTGIYDKHQEEIYEMDVLLKGDKKFLVRWNPELNGWYFSPIEVPQHPQSLSTSEALQMLRLCSYFEGETK
jgi:hypothetical protein